MRLCATHLVEVQSFHRKAARYALTSHPRSRKPSLGRPSPAGLLFGKATLAGNLPVVPTPTIRASPQLPTTGHRPREHAQEPKTIKGGHHHSTRIPTCSERSPRELKVDPGGGMTSRPTGVDSVPLGRSLLCEDPGSKRRHGECADLHRGGYPVDRAGLGLKDGLPRREVNILSGLPVMPSNWTRGCGTIMAATNRPVLAKQRSGGDGAKLSMKKTRRIIAFDVGCVGGTYFTGIEGDDAVRLSWGGGSFFGDFSRTASKESKNASLWLPLDVPRGPGVRRVRLLGVGDERREDDEVTGAGLAPHHGHTVSHHHHVVACSPERSNHTMVSPFVYQSVPRARIPSTSTAA